jgi:nucleoside-diphosphate-sugar epimerase
VKLRVLVTGGRGFIGSFLVEKLLRKGFKVRCLLRRKPDYGWLQNLPFEHVEGDVTEPESLASAVSGVRYIFHLAGVTRAVRSRDYMAINAEGTRNLLEAVKNQKEQPHRFVLVSSLAAGGPGSDGRIISESDVSRPVSNYGRSKLLAEEIVKQYSDSFPYTIIRPPTVFGPRDTDVFEFFRYVKQGWRPDMTGGPRQGSLVFVDDLVDAILSACENPKAINETYYICYDKPVLWDDFIARIADIMQKRQPVTIKLPIFAAGLVAFCAELWQRVSGSPGLISLDKFQELKQKNWVCDNGKIKRELGFKPGITLSAALQKTYSWYRSENWL